MARPAEPAPALDLLGVRVGLAGAVDRLRDRIPDLLAGDGVPATTRAELALPADADPADLLALLTAAVVRHSPLLCIHAAVLGHGDGVLALPGQSGLGKSTLAAALARHGLAYLSDEALALDRATGAVARFPRPVSIAPDVWPLLGIEESPAPGEAERQFPPSRFGRLAPVPDWPAGAPRVRHVVLAERRPGPAELKPGTEAGAVQALLGRAFNHFHDPAGSLATVLAVVRGARVWRAGYAQAPELAGLLADRLG
ncbi:MAG TPA: hypothetical protein VMB79_08205 [Jatrophihabitans sp.]|nr:hypothetical protein [Jatrophihabitans sp.]